jgi:hypothetical protein
MNQKHKNTSKNEERLTKTIKIQKITQQITTP